MASRKRAAQPGDPDRMIVRIPAGDVRKLREIVRERGLAEGLVGEDEAEKRLAVAGIGLAVGMPARLVEAASR